jgi:hypothetical protein
MYNSLEVMSQYLFLYGGGPKRRATRNLEDQWTNLCLVPTFDLSGMGDQARSQSPRQSSSEGHSGERKPLHRDTVVIRNEGSRLALALS